MRANIAATDIDHEGGEAARAASQQSNAPLSAACSKACDLIRDYFTRGSPLISNEPRPIEETALAELGEELKAAVDCVARLPSSGFEDVGLKRRVQHALRPYHEMCDNLVKNVGSSVDRDMQILLERAERDSLNSQSGWFGRNFALWKRAESTPLLHAL